MNKVDYINSVVGKPYKKGGDGPDFFDCWGVVPHSFLNIEGIKIPDATDRDKCDLNESSKKDLEIWIECDVDDADIFCCYENQKMVHVGRVLLGKALHSADYLTNGSVALWSLRKIKLVYRNIKFFKFVGC